jgi:hypothetical protein
MAALIAMSTRDEDAAPRHPSALRSRNADFSASGQHYGSEVREGERRRNYSDLRTSSAAWPMLRSLANAVVRLK